MTEFERVLINSFNAHFKEAGINARSPRLKQHLFTSQNLDVLVDYLNPDLYLGIECKSISVEKGATALYFSQHFTVDKKGVHQIERISDYLQKTGRKGFLAVELRMGVWHTKQAHLIPWGVVEKKYREKAVKIPIEQIKTHSELKRRNKTHGLSSLLEPLRKTRLDSLKNHSSDTHN